MKVPRSKVFDLGLSVALVMAYRSLYSIAPMHFVSILELSLSKMGKQHLEMFSGYGDFFIYFLILLFSCDSKLILSGSELIFCRFSSR